MAVPGIHCCVTNHPKHSVVVKLLVLTDSEGSGIQTEHFGDGFLLFYSIWDLSWRELMFGSQNHLEVSSQNHPEVSSQTCLAIKTSSPEAIGQNTSVWPLLGSWTSSQHGGWIPRLSVP